MCIDLGRGRLLLPGGEWRRRQTGVYLIENEHLDIRLDLLLLPETVELGEPRLYGRQQVAARLFDALPCRLRGHPRRFDLFPVAMLSIFTSSPHRQLQKCHICDQFGPRREGIEKCGLVP